MLAMLAAMAVASGAVAQAPPSRLHKAEVQAEPFAAVFPGLRTRQACKSAGRMQTSLAEPALLFREQDRSAAHLRKLIELPPADACLLGGADGVTAGK